MGGCAAKHWYPVSTSWQAGTGDMGLRSFLAIQVEQGLMFVSKWLGRRELRTVVRGVWPSRDHCILALKDSEQ